MVSDRAQLWQQGIRNAHRLNERPHSWLGSARDALKPDSTITAAAIAYFALFSLFPLILLNISIASFKLDPLMDRQLIVQKLKFIAPALGQMLGKNIDEIFHARGPVTSVALVGLIWPASTIFYTLAQTLNGIWGNQRSRTVWKQRSLAILVVLTFIGLTLFLAWLSGIIVANIRPLLPDQIIPIGVSMSFVVAILIDVALFMVLYIVLPTWKLLPSASNSLERLWPACSGVCPKKSLFDLGFHLHLRLESGLWFSGIHYLLSGLGLSVGFQKMNRRRLC